MINEQWTVNFNKGILGWTLVSARKKGERVLHGTSIPPRVREWALADARGVVSHPDAIAAIEQVQRNGRASLKTEDITRPTKPRPTPPILDWDEAEYLGDGKDGVYFGTVREGRKWWALASIDSNTGHFTQSLAADPGYTSEKRALIAARDAAIDWLVTNEIGFEIDDGEGE